jgi:phage gp46-like protein
MTDVRIYHTDDGGEIDYVNGKAVMSRDGLESSVYLSMFGGNDEDGGIEADDPKQWWGNVDELDTAKRYRSETQHLLRTAPAIPATLQRVQESVERDLAWMTATEVSDEVSVVVTMPALNTVRIAIDVTVDGERHQLSFDGRFGVVN